MDINNCLRQFKPISLKDMNSVSLMNRTDVKFLFKKSQLPILLSELISHYNILKIENKMIQVYKSLYFDTHNRLFYMSHHNRRVNRNKVRFREYVDSDLFFLEIKLKNNKGKTIKTRMRVDKIYKNLLPEHNLFIKSAIGRDLSLIAQHWINFNRITLVDKLNTERITIDLDLNYSNDSQSGSLDNIIIAEVKKDRSSQSSKFTYIAKEYHIIPTRMSKYCISTINLNKNVKFNRFKSKILLINKLQLL
tara:strand:- start:259 stop:1005 length:747 start_codon:yes stop_codon:yes gene_type:complete